MSDTDPAAGDGNQPFDSRSRNQILVIRDEYPELPARHSRVIQAATVMVKPQTGMLEKRQRWLELVALWTIAPHGDERRNAGVPCGRELLQTGMGHLPTRLDECAVEGARQQSQFAGLRLNDLDRLPAEPDRTYTQYTAE